MVRILIVAMSMSLSMAVSGSGQGVHVNVELLQGTLVNYERVGVTSGCYRTPGGSCDGVFWRTNRSYGVTSGSLKSQADIPATEFLYEFSLSRLGNGYRLRGAVYTLIFAAPDTIWTGHRQYYDLSLSHDESRLINVGSDHQGRAHLFRISISGEPLVSRREGASDASRVTLHSSQIVDNQRWSVVKNVQNAMKDSVKFSAGFSTKPDDPVQKQLEYDFLIVFDSLPETITEPVRTTVTLKRIYVVNERGQSEATTRWNYSSNYSRQIELRPGKLTELVIPPDTPSVEGFDILDTLQIYPGTP